MTRHRRPEDPSPIPASDPAHRPHLESHGSFTLLRRLKAGTLDFREGVGRELWEIRRQLFLSLGAKTPRDLTAQQQALIEQAAVKIQMLRMMWEYALSRRSIIGKGGALIAPLSKSFLGFSNSLRRDLEVLGMNRVTREAALDLDAYVAQRYGDGNREGTQDRPASAAARGGDAGGAHGP